MADCWKKKKIGKTQERDKRLSDSAEDSMICFSLD